MGAPALACSGEFFDMAHRANYFCFVLITLPIAIWGQDARDLIAHADAAVFAATTLHMSGSSLLSMDLPGATSMEVPFTISRAGERVRSDIGRLMNLQVEVFDGKTVTTYWASTNTYSRVVTRTTAEPMHLRILRFGQNAGNLISAAVEQEESPEFEGRLTPCDVVHAAYRGFALDANAKNVVRTVWIARESGIVVRDSWEMDMASVGPRARTTFVYKYDIVDVDKPLADDTFVFQPPVGSHEATVGNKRLTMQPTILGDPLAKLTPLTQSGPANGTSSGAGTRTDSVKVTDPVMVRKVAPEYTEVARAAMYQGDVLVSVGIDRNGRALGARVIRGLGMGLDEKAYASIMRSEFRSGTKNGEPVSMTHIFEV